ncbi:MAG: threonine synthase [Steroidobacteraceae bacterium]|jgi:threonine synthase|nr:threonine synthase [Steroidobacteraceae bacterium]
MQYLSTRGDVRGALGFGEALRRGLAPDGGLYVPASWPVLHPQDFGDELSLPAVAARLIAPFAAGDAVLAPALGGIVRDAFDFPAPVVPIGGDPDHAVLELFHGPTAAFKDFGARFLAACFQRLRQPSDLPVNILVATSGDTGGAVAAAFHRRPGMQVTVLFPKGLVSPLQQQQLTCWGDNVRSLAVRGTFDDCQALVKQAFVDPGMQARFQLSSANSINLGRLLPQAVYFAASSLAAWRRTGRPLSFIVPSGNLGHAVACCWTRTVGLPVGQVILAHNANRTVPDYLDSGEWRPRPSVATLASAMDVGNPSNMERLRALYPDVGAMRGALSACSVDDATIAARIRADFERYGQVWCPHTAIAAEAWARLPDEARGGGPWCIVATAHPAKFAEIVEPLVGRKVEVPPSLRALYERPSSFAEIDPDLAALRAALAG